MIALLILLSTSSTDARMEAAIKLDWQNQTCPNRNDVAKALATYGVRVSSDSFVLVRMQQVGESELVLVLEAKGGQSLRKVSVPRACSERAAVVSVVIEALISPYFWPEGRTGDSSSQPQTPISALDLLLAEVPASEPASVPATVPASSQETSSQESLMPSGKPDSSSASIAANETKLAQTPNAPPLKLALGLFGGMSLGLPEPVKWRFGVWASLTWRDRLRWFFEGDVLAERRVDFAPGVVVALPVHLFVGMDVRLFAGWFAGVGTGLQLLIARAEGFDENRNTVIVSPSLQIRTGYRHTFVNRFEIGAHVLLRTEFGRVLLLIDETVAYEAPALHVGAVATFAVVL